ncbi:Hypothetical protein ETEE_0326 [Edwardsiella anguillarum ET080813]|uniref:Uncharacterized protein n=1 Tax=Edwardsiella anguillarum ET080813 TaxID=667120 RepID=A0A076LM92_9GAMM|nr:Hypothetical protein ETEE_0326 [Edwardsiella anguillarum ET080813]
MVPCLCDKPLVFARDIMKKTCQLFICIYYQVVIFITGINTQR